MLAKLLASFIGLVTILVKIDTSPYIQAFLIGILPIWSEVLASRLTKVEPARTNKKSMLYMDAIIDAFVFLVLPSFWFLRGSAPSTPEKLAIAIFISFGAFRLVKFVGRGLHQDGYFRGLPVTYTGYIWLPITLFKTCGFDHLISPILFLAATAMITTKIKIRAGTFT